MDPQCVEIALIIRVKPLFVKPTDRSQISLCWQLSVALMHSSALQAEHSAKETSFFATTESTYSSSTPDQLERVFAWCSLVKMCRIMSGKIERFLPSGYCRHPRRPSSRWPPSLSRSLNLPKLEILYPAPFVMRLWWNRASETWMENQFNKSKSFSVWFTHRKGNIPTKMNVSPYWKTLEWCKYTHSS